MYYSKSEGGFYIEGLHTDIPKDAVIITTEEWQNLMSGQTKGQQISGDANGYPILTGNVMVQQG